MLKNKRGKSTMGFPGVKFILNRLLKRRKVWFVEEPREYSGYMKILRFWFSMSGLWRSAEDRSLNVLWSSVILTLLSVGLLGTLHQLLFVPQDLSGRTEVLLNVSLIGHSIFTYVVLIWKRAVIMKMLLLVESDFNNFTSDLGLKSVFRRKAENFNMMIVVTVSVIIFSVHLSFIGVSKVFLIGAPLRDKTLLFPVSVPLEMTHVVYHAVFLLELLVTFFEAVVHITSISVCAGFINLLCAELLSLGEAFRLLGLLARHRAASCRTPEGPEACVPGAHLDLHADKLLNTFVDQHKLLIGFYKDLQSTFELPILDMFVNSQVMLCTSGFHLYKLFQKDAPQQLFKMLCMFAALVSHEFVYFWFGSKLTQQAERFRQDVYGCGWQDRCLRFSRGYRILQERLKREVVIQAVVLPANLLTFTKCLQAAVSYFNLLLALSHDQ